MRGNLLSIPQILLLSEKKISPELHILPFLTENSAPLKYDGTTVMNVRFIVDQMS